MREDRNGADWINSQPSFFPKILCPVADSASKIYRREQSMFKFCIGFTRGILRLVSQRACGELHVRLKIKLLNIGQQLQCFSSPLELWGFHSVLRS